MINQKLNFNAKLGFHIAWEKLWCESQMQNFENMMIKDRQLGLNFVKISLQIM